MLYQFTCIFLINTEYSSSGNVLKEVVHDLAVRLSSSGCTWEVGRALEKLEKHLASPRATQTFLLQILSQLPTFIRNSITQ